MKPFDPTKPVQLEDGTPARIVCADRKGGCPIVALIGEQERVLTFEYDGSSPYGTLVNVPEKHVRWVNIYPSAQETREGADAQAHTDRIACIRVEFEEGEGL